MRRAKKAKQILWLQDCIEQLLLYDNDIIINEEEGFPL